MVSLVTFFRCRRSLRNCLNRSAEARGLQHGSASDVDRGSIGAPCPLSHLAVLVLKLLPCNNFGGPSRTRTCDLLVRSQPRSDANRSRPRKIGVGSPPSWSFDAACGRVFRNGLQFLASAQPSSEALATR